MAGIWLDIVGNAWQGFEAPARKWRLVGLYRAFTLSQWTMAAAPRHPAIQHVLDHVAARLEAVSATELLRGDLQQKTITLTGPAAWSAALFAFLHHTTYVDWDTYRCVSRCLFTVC